MKYQIWLKGMTKFVEVKAEGVELDTADCYRSDSQTAFWNFLTKLGENSITVAAFPFIDVAYIVSVE